MVQIYKKQNYVIYGFGDECVIHNKNKRFENGHTHVKNFKTAKYLVDLAIHKSIPRNKCKRFLQSLYRITDDYEYQTRIQTICDDKLEIYQKNNKKHYKKVRG